MRWFEPWYNKYAVMVLSAAVGLAAYNWINWSCLSASDWGTWVGAIGTAAAVLASFFLFQRQREHEMQQARDDELARRTRSIQAMQDVVYWSIDAVNWCIRNYEAYQGPFRPAELPHFLDRVDELRSMLDQFVDPGAERVVNLTAMFFGKALIETKIDFLTRSEQLDDIVIDSMRSRHSEMLQYQLRLITQMQALERQCRELGIDI